MVFAVTDKEKRANGGITAFLVERDSPGFKVGHGAQRPADEPLNFHGATALSPPSRFASRSGLGGARDHAVLAGDPASFRAFQKGRDAVLNRGGADDAGLSQPDERRAFGARDEVGRDLDWTQRRRRASVAANEFAAGIKQTA